MGILDGRIAIVTGAGRGIGRAHALELARQGAKVVVNDFGVSISGEGTGESPADEVVALIQEMGGEAVTNGADVADWDQAEAMVRQAIDMGTHTLFVGEVVDAGVNDDERRAAAISDTKMKYGGVKRGGH